MNDGKISSIQSLRGIAACYVMLFHLSHITFYPTVSPPNYLAWFVDAGLSGVSLFFIISAYTMCLSSDSRHENSLTPFLVRRFFRIAPLFYTWIALACTRDYLIFGKLHSTEEVIWNALFLINFKRDFIEGIPWAGWTIGVEMTFYACFPLIFNLTKSIQRAIIALTIFLAIGLQWSAHFLELHSDSKYAMMGFASRLPIFILGILLYRLQKASENISQKYKIFVAPGSVTLGCGLIGFASYTRSGILLLPLDYTQALGWALLVYGMLVKPPRLANFKPLLFVGEISYSVYLSHATVLHLLSFAGLFSAISVWTGDEGLLFYLSCFSIGMAIVLATSYVTYLLIERPGIKLGSSLLRAKSKPQIAQPKM